MTRTDNRGDTMGDKRGGGGWRMEDGSGHTKRRRNTRDEQLHVGGVRSLDDVTAIYCFYFTLLYS